MKFYRLYRLLLQFLSKYKRQPSAPNFKNYCSREKKILFNPELIRESFDLVLFFIKY